MGPDSHLHIVRRAVTGCAVCLLSTSTISAIVLLVVFRVLLGECDFGCDKHTQEPEAGSAEDCDGDSGCNYHAKLGYYVCLWVVIGIVGIWFFIGITWMGLIWVHPVESSLPDTFESLPGTAQDVPSSDGFPEVNLWHYLAIILAVKRHTIHVPTPAAAKYFKSLKVGMDNATQPQTSDLTKQ